MHVVLVYQVNDEYNVNIECNYVPYFHVGAAYMVIRSDYI